MIIIDVIFNIYSYVIFLPFLSYLFKYKRRTIYYVLYGLMLDLVFMNKYLLNTILILTFYKFFPKKKKTYLLFFIITYNAILINNLVIHNNVFFVLSPIYIVSFILNVLFYINCDKNYTLLI